MESGGEGGRAGTALAHPLTTPIPHARPGVGYIWSVGAAGTVQQPEQTQIVPNLSSIYILFYTVIYNSVAARDRLSLGTRTTVPLRPS